MAGNTLEFNDAAFDADVLKSEVPVLVDFWAPWCQPCLRLTPTIEAIATDYLGRIKVGKVNTDENPKVSTQYGIQSIPTLVVFIGGKVVQTIQGAQPKERIAAMIDSSLAHAAT